VKQTSTEHGEVNLLMKTLAYAHSRVDRNELKAFGVVCLFVIHLFLKIFPKLVVVYLCTLSCAPATQTRFAPAA